MILVWKNFKADVSNHAPWALKKNLSKIHITFLILSSVGSGQTLQDELVANQILR